MLTGSRAMLTGSRAMLTGSRTNCKEPYKFDRRGPVVMQSYSVLKLLAIAKTIIYTKL